MNRTVLSLATLLRCLKHRTCSQAQLRVQWPECWLRVLLGNPESPVEPWQELLQHPVGFSDAAGTSQAKFSYQPILKGACRSLHATFCLGRLSKNHLDPELVHCPAELGWHPGEAGTGRVPEDGVAVGVEGDGYAETLHETLDQQEVVATVFLTAEEGVNYCSGGIVHRDQQRKRRRLIPQPRVVTAVHLDQHALPGHALAAYPVLGRTPSPRTAQPGVDQDAPQGGPADVDAVALAEQLAEMGVASPCVPGTSQTHYAGHHGIRCRVGWPAAPVTMGEGSCAFLPVGRQNAPGAASGDTHQRGCLVQCHVLSEQTVQNLKSCLFFLRQSHILHEVNLTFLPAS